MNFKMVIKTPMSSTDPVKEQKDKCILDRRMNGNKKKLSWQKLCYIISPDDLTTQNSHKDPTILHKSSQKAQWNVHSWLGEWILTKKFSLQKLHYIISIILSKTTHVYVHFCQDNVFVNVLSTNQVSTCSSSPWMDLWSLESDDSWK